ncbi:MAG TPA: PCRF domain-containing protein, partial [Edaphobacter sp.]
MFDRLDQMEARYEELGQQLADPALVTDQKKFTEVARNHRELEPVVEKFREYRNVRQGVADAKTMLAEDDADIREMAQAELLALEPRLAEIEEELKIMLLPRDPNDDKN